MPYVLSFLCLFSFNIYLVAVVTICWNMNALSAPCFVLFVFKCLCVVIIIEPLGEAG